MLGDKLSAKANIKQVFVQRSSSNLKIEIFLMNKNKKVIEYYQNSDNQARKMFL